MSTETAQLFSGLLTVATALLGISVIVLRLATAAGDERARQVGSTVSDAGVWLAFLIATGSMLGSLWFSEVADFVPCRLCWFQRIAMYPLVAVLFVGAIRRETAVRWYAGPIALVGAGIAGYHTLIEWRPSLDTGVCELTGPSCTFVWFREFGFISLATMALTAFLTILILLFVRFPARLDATPEVEMETVS